MSRRESLLYLALLGAVALIVLVQHRLAVSAGREAAAAALRSIAEETARQIDGDIHEQMEIDDPEVVFGFEYEAAQSALKQALAQHKLKTPLFTLRPLAGGGAVYITTTSEIQRIGAEAPFPPEAQRALSTGQVSSTGIYDGERGEQWLSAYAPIQTKEGKHVALVRVDQPAGRLLDAERRAWLWRASLLLGGGAFAFVLLAAALAVRERGLRRAIAQALLGRLGVQLGLSFAILIALGVSISTSFSYATARRDMVRSVGEKLRATVYLGALAISGEVHEAAYENGKKSTEFNELLEALRKIQERAGLATDIYTVRQTEEGPTVVATSNGPGFPLFGVPIRPEQERALEGGAFHTELYELPTADRKGVKHLVSAYASILDVNHKVVGVLVADQEVEDLLVQLENQLLESVLYGLIGALLAVGIALLFTRAISRPLKTLTVACQEIGHGNFDVPIPVKRRDELGVLGDTLRHMLVELKARDQMLEREIQVRSNYERFFPPQIASLATRDAEELFRPGGGRELTVTVLFADIRNYTALSREMPPREVAEMLNEYFTAVVAEVFRKGGTLEKYIGDALMAIWGAPFPAPQQAPDATEAAINMLRAIRQLNERWKKTGKSWHLEVGIGLNTGVCFVGNIGTADYLQYAAIGATTNLAARLCSLAGPAEIVLSEASRRALVDVPCPIEPMSPFVAKGFDAAITPYRVRWEEASEEELRALAGE